MPLGYKKSQAWPEDRSRDSDAVAVADEDTVMGMDDEEITPMLELLWGSPIMLIQNTNKAMIARIRRASNE